jgi:fatty acid desaturase
MRHTLFPSDESLPTWLHTLLLFLIVSPFFIFLFMQGISAIVSGHLEPLSGPEFGQFFFGNVTLVGKTAKIAGVSLIVLGFGFVALAVQFSRLAIAELVARIWLPWVLIVIHIGLSFWVNSIT